MTRRSIGLGVVSGCIFMAGLLFLWVVAPLQSLAQSGLDPNYDTGSERDYQPRERTLSPREQRCQQLEQELVLETQRRDQGRFMLPQLYEDQRKFERNYQVAKRQAERRNCYQYFLFSKTLRRTRRCLKLDRAIQDARGRLADLHSRIESIRNARTDGYRRQQLINTLARYRCGEIYQRSARRNRSRSWNPFSSIFGDRGGSDYYDNAPADVEPETGIVAGATYRTMCVRLCDGYYFPISFATIPSKFNSDRITCQSKCAAPSELFVYRNPGGQVEQMISTSGAPYSKIENAFRYRKQYVKGCSCKPDVYDPDAVSGEDQTAGGEAGSENRADGPIATPKVARKPKVE